jgi:tol-pal system protein YbgF
MAGGMGQSGQNRQSKEDTQLLQAGTEAYNIGDYNQAIGKLDQFINRYPDSDSVPEALFFLGQSYYRMKDYQKAMTTYKKIDSNFSLYPKAGEALYKVGKCLEALGNKDFAVRVFKKVAAKYPSFNKDNIKD